MFAISIKIDSKMLHGQKNREIQHKKLIKTNHNILLRPFVMSWCLSIKYASLAFLTKGFLDFIFSKGVTWMSVWLCPGKRKCWPTGVFVLVWQSCRMVLRCPTNLASAVLDVSPSFCFSPLYLLFTSEPRLMFLVHR